MISDTSAPHVLHREERDRAPGPILVKTFAKLRVAQSLAGAPCSRGLGGDRNVRHAPVKDRGPDPFPPVRQVVNLRIEVQLACEEQSVVCHGPQDTQHQGGARVERDRRAWLSYDSLERTVDSCCALGITEPLAQAQELVSQRSGGIGIRRTELQGLLERPHECVRGLGSAVCGEPIRALDPGVHHVRAGLGAHGVSRVRGGLEEVDEGGELSDVAAKRVGDSDAMPGHAGGLVVESKPEQHKRREADVEARHLPRRVRGLKQAHGLRPDPRAERCTARIDSPLLLTSERDAVAAAVARSDRVCGQLFHGKISSFSNGCPR